MKDFWNARYAQNASAYGEAPNIFFRQQLDRLLPGSILLPAEGQGRNAIYAAKSGWAVTAFDISEQACINALHLADQQGVSVNYHIGSVDEIGLDEAAFDAVALIFAHFPAQLKSRAHHRLNQWLKPGGTVIFEAFSKAHLQYSMADPAAGGPKDINMLCSIEEIASDFKHYEHLVLEEKVVTLNEGLFHQGTSSVIRFIGRKK